MSARLLGHWPDGSPEWHEARRWRIGGSDIGQIMGWSPFGTRDDMLTAKLSGPDPDRVPTKAQMRGTLLEPAILAWGEQVHGYRYDETRRGTWLHGVFNWALFNPDAVTTDGLLIECKSTADRSTDRGWGRAGTDHVPLHYRAQVTYGMGILGLDAAHLIVLHGATNGRPDLAFCRYRVPFDRPLFNRLLAAGLAFHNDITAARNLTAAA